MIFKYRFSISAHPPTHKFISFTFCIPLEKYVYHPSNRFINRFLGLLNVWYSVMGRNWRWWHTVEISIFNFLNWFPCKRDVRSENIALCSSASDVHFVVARGKGHIPPKRGLLRWGWMNLYWFDLWFRPKLLIYLQCDNDNSNHWVLIWNEGENSNKTEFICEKNFPKNFGSSFINGKLITFLEFFFNKY